MVSQVASLFVVICTQLVKRIITLRLNSSTSSVTALLAALLRAKLATRMLKVLFVFKNGDQLFFELATTVKNLGAKWLSGKKLISRPATEMAILIF